MPIWTPITFSDADVQRAIQAIKSQRPDLWERFLEHEKKDEGYADIGRDLMVLLHKENEGKLSSADLSQLLSQVRREVRREAGQPI